MTPSDDRQLSFFARDQMGTYSCAPPEEVRVSSEALQQWKQRVWDYQQQRFTQGSIEQGTLFDLQPAISLPDPECIDPFQLPRQNTQFWRWQVHEQGVAALYFVIDYEGPILLYVGETVHSNQRWKGEHDCKRYLLNYQQAHYTNQLPTSLSIAFWNHAPQDYRQRRKLESTLIYKWRSPFNKENWEFWGTPFVN
ncbi:MAG: GIY-YIG nuclease family protein [Leptolyngbyaceae cyanobacterium bins.59]|nr:GIY-YIG nuclease family protein [Leptolyngbyaceae cyanobacterium bins.59]